MAARRRWRHNEDFAQVGDGGELVAAARLYDINSDTRVIRARNQWVRQKHSSVWEWYENIGEVHYAISKGGRLAGRAQLAVYELDDMGRPSHVSLNPAAVEVSNLITSPFGGQAHLIQRFYQLMKIPAFGHLERVVDPNGDTIGYEVRSADEITINDDGSAVVTLIPSSGGMPGSQTESLISAGNLVGDFWTPSPRYLDVPDSPLMAIDSVCRQLHILTCGTIAKLTSRLAMSGMLWVPDSVRDVQTAVSLGGGPNSSQDRQLQTFLRAMVSSTSNPNDPTSTVPILMFGPAGDADGLKFLDPARDIVASDMALRQELIGRILTGLDMSSSGVTGRTQASHWSSWADSDEDLRANLAPELEKACWVAAKFIAWPELVKRGEDPAKYVVWYDPADLTSHVNKAEVVRLLNAQGVASPEAALRHSGLDAMDALEGDGLIRWIGMQLRDPYLATYGLDQEIDWEMVGKGNSRSGPVGGVDDGRVGPGVGQPGSPGGNNSDAKRTQKPV